MRDLPHLIYLQAFEAAARHLSFTRAAEELNCTQAAISQRVRGLERYFGRPLFQRQPNGLLLSLAGKAYLPGITQALDMAESATRGLTGRRVQHSVTVSAPISFLNLWLAPKLRRFQADNPAVELRLNSSIWTDPNIELADVSVEIMERELLPQGAVALSQERLVLVTSPQDAERLDQGVPLDALSQIEVQGKYQLWEIWLDAARLKRAPGPAAIRVDNALTALELATAGLGATVVYSTYASEVLAAGWGVAPFGAGVAVPHVLALRRNPDRKQTGAVRDFIAWVSGQFPAVE